MAKKSVLELFVPFDQLALSEGILMTDKSATKLIYTDFDSGSEVIVEGEGFKVKSGKVIAGVVEDLTILNSQGKVAMEFSGLEISAKSMPQPVPIALLSGVLNLGLTQSNIIIGSKKDDVIEAHAGKDEIRGGKGDDFLDGGQGKDVLIGGSGEDQFHFTVGSGKDTIMDFDADGSDGHQDLLDADPVAIISKTTVNGNAVLDFGNGDTLTLIGVKASEIDGSDFVA